MTHLALLCCIFTFIGQSLPNTALISEQIQAKLNSRNRANKSFLGKRGGFGGGGGGGFSVDIDAVSCQLTVP